MFDIGGVLILIVVLSVSVPWPRNAMLKTGSANGF